MKKVNLKDRNFPHQEYVTPFYLEASFQWDRGCHQNDPTVYTDAYLNDLLTGIPGEKIAWLVEPVSIYPGIYNWICKNYSLFKEVWTHDDEILKLVPIAKFVPTGGCWIEPDNIKISRKSRLCSFIASNKNWTIGHKLRQHIRSVLPPSIPQFGRGFKEIGSKSEALMDYAYSIVVENSKRDTYFTEKIIDCFLTGTIPIYWGTNKVTEYFDPNGIIFFRDTGELELILKNISLGDYLKRMEAVTANFEHSRKFILPEEWGLNPAFLRV